MNAQEPTGVEVEEVDMPCCEPTDADHMTAGTGHSVWCNALPATGASSLGTPEAVALRASVPDEAARRLNFAADMSALADLLRDRGPFDAVVGIPRGGLAVAAMLGYLLDVSTVAAHGQRYVRRGGTPVVGPIYSTFQAVQGERILVVEDATVTGTLLAEAGGFYMERGAGVTTAALYVTAGEMFRPDVWVYEVDEVPSGRVLLGLAQAIERAAGSSSGTGTPAPSLVEVARQIVPGHTTCAGCGDDIWPGEVSHPGADGTVLCAICEAKGARAASALAERLRAGTGTPPRAGINDEPPVDVEARAVRDVVNAAEGPRMVSTKGCRRMLDAIRAAFPAGDFVATDEEHQRAVAVAAGYSNAGPTARKYARLIMAAVSAAAGVSPAQGGDHGA